jgi:hypothetical protein
MAVIARNGSKLVKDVREKKDKDKSRARFWEVAGSKMGNITGGWAVGNGATHDLRQAVAVWGVSPLSEWRGLFCHSLGCIGAGPAFIEEQCSEQKGTLSWLLNPVHVVCSRSLSNLGGLNTVALGCLLLPASPAGLTETEKDEAAKAAEAVREQQGGSDDDGDDYRKASKVCSFRGWGSL